MPIFFANVCRGAFIGETIKKVPRTVKEIDPNHFFEGHQLIYLSPHMLPK